MKHNQNLGKRHAYRFYIINLRKAWRENNQRTLAKQANNNCENDKTFAVQKQRSGNKQKDLNNSVVVNDTTRRTTNDTKKRINNAKRVTNDTKKRTNDTKRVANNTKRVTNDTKKKSNSSRRKKTQGMTYSQKKRASFNYRNEYFKKNPGIYGNIWFCSQCGKILIGKHNVVIDHIMPLNNVAGVNRTFNTVAICQKCNSSKSDSVDYRVVKGYLAKLFEVFTSHLPDALALVLSLIVSLAYQIFNLLFILVTMPLTLANGKFLTYAVVILTQNSMCFVTEALEISPIKLKGDSSLKTMPDKQFNKKFAERVLSFTPLSILSQEKQKLLVEKANEMIKKYKFNSVWDALTFAGILFAIPEALAQLIHVWDLTKVNPKIVMVLTGTRKLEPKEEVMLQYLHAIGLDVLLFVPTGYGLVTEDLLRSGLQKIDLGNYNFSIQYSEITSNRKGLLSRLFHRKAK